MLFSGRFGVMMDPTIILAVLAAAFLHAFWNFQVRGSTDKALGLGAVMLGHIPLAVAGMVWAGLPPLSTWPFLLASSFLHLGYQIFLMNAYRFGELGQIYPIARGIAPLLIAVVGMLLLQTRFAPQEMVGVLLVSGGIIMHGIFQFIRTKTPLTGLGLAVVTGCFIASYSLVDGHGVRDANNALGYYGMLTMLNGVPFAIYLRVFHPGVISRIPTEGRNTVIFGGTASYIAYGLVLWACLSAPIAVVSALRETSVLFALFLGTVLLHEKFTLTKLAVTITILAGVVTLRLA